MNSQTNNKWFSGSVSGISGVVVQLTSSDNQSIKRGVTIVADSGNPGLVFLGPLSTVTYSGVASTDGFPIGPNQSVSLPLDNMAKIYCIANNGTNKVYWFGI